MQMKKYKLSKVERIFCKLKSDLDPDRIHQYIQDNMLQKGILGNLLGTSHKLFHLRLDKGLEHTLSMLI